MTLMDLLIALHEPAYRQGPGGDKETAMAAELAGLVDKKGLTIADLGCGTGASTLQLATMLDATITAVDFLPEFLLALQQRAESKGVADRITCLEANFDNLPFADEQYDVIWSEGAIYNMGFSQGIKRWRPFLKPNGLLVVSEISWLTASRPKSLEAHWQKQYPEMATISEKMSQLEQLGYSPLASFVLPDECWVDNYYSPMRARFSTFVDDYGAEAKKLVDNEEQEIRLFQNYKNYFGYCFFIAKKVST